MIVAELERQERGFVEVMQTLVQDYLQPLQQVNPPVISNDMVFFNSLVLSFTYVWLSVRTEHNLLLHCSTC